MSIYSSDDSSYDCPTSSATSPTFLEDAEFHGWAGPALGGSQDFVQELLELGEESLEFSAAEDELRKLHTRLNDAESRESQLKQELDTKKQRICQLEDVVAQLKKEVLEERARAKDEAEDMAQEMAEFRYQMSELLEEERQLRAHTEKVSVQRVEELELQLKQAREEVIAALARRQESESRAERDVLNLRLELQHAQQQLEKSSSFQDCKQCAILSEEISQLKAELSSTLGSSAVEGEHEVSHDEISLEAESTVVTEDQKPTEFPAESNESQEPTEFSAESDESLHQQPAEFSAERDESPEVEQKSNDSSAESDESLHQQPTDFSAERDESQEVEEKRNEESTQHVSQEFEPERSLLRESEDSDLPKVVTSEGQALVQQCKHCVAFSDEILRLKTELTSMVTSTSDESAELPLPDSAETGDTNTTSREEVEVCETTEEMEETPSVEAEEMEETPSVEAEPSASCLDDEVARLQQIIEHKSAELEVAHEELATCRSNLDSQSELVEDLSRRMKDFEAELQVEKGSLSDSVLKCTGLSSSLDETSQKLSTAEAELELYKNKNAVLQEGFEAAEGKLSDSIKEKIALHEDLQQLRGLLEAQEQSLQRQQQELFSQRAANGQLARRIGDLNSEVLILQQQLITCQTQVSEMAMKNVILEDTVLAKKRKIKEGEEVMSEQAVKLAKQEEVYFKLQAKLSALQNDFSTLEAKLDETRRKEQEARMQMDRLSLELTMAKQEVVSSEVRMQKTLKQAKEQADAGKRKFDDLFVKHKITERQLRKAEAKHSVS